MIMTEAEQFIKDHYGKWRPKDIAAKLNQDMRPHYKGASSWSQWDVVGLAKKLKLTWKYTPAGIAHRQQRRAQLLANPTPIPSNPAPISRIANADYCPTCNRATKTVTKFEVPLDCDPDLEDNLGFSPYRGPA